ncbi:MAG: hypothetical protein U0736_08095 [Gemmataceae bacterium]
MLAWNGNPGAAAGAGVDRHGIRAAGALLGLLVHLRQQLKTADGRLEQRQPTGCLPSPCWC